MQKLLSFFSKNISVYAIHNDQSFNDRLTNNMVSFEQLGPDIFLISLWKHMLWVFIRSTLRVASNEYPQHIFPSRNKKKYCMDINSYLELCRGLKTQDKRGIHIKKNSDLPSACIKGSLGVRDFQKLSWDFQKSMPGSLGLPTFKDILVIYNKNLEWIYVLFSLRMVALLHKWELRILRLYFWKWVKKFDHQDFEILELGSPGTSWFWQLMQALFTHKKICNGYSLEVLQGTRHFQWVPKTYIFSISTFWLEKN